ncbi:hypothetical protein J5N97_018341 [Dioscorea zingiberensis]|uniref:Uncharacterized protein n=1 Tax=Dioscorea zingiberensis TaxID=325984 RepID=A0A9D5CN05_9LILI|nr:hypothetical protein J5N97_018341 [Dioscorea zingiberensis]
MPDAGECNDKIPGRREEAMAKAEFSSGNEVLNSSNSVHLENHSESSEDGFPLVKAPYPPERVSFNPYCGLQESNMLECNLSNEFASNTCKTMAEYGKDVAHDCIIPLGADKYGNETITQFDAKLYVLANDDQNHNLACKMHQNQDVTSFSIVKDHCSRMKKNMENFHPIWTEVEHDRMTSVHKGRDRFQPELNESHKRYGLTDEGYFDTRSYGHGQNKETHASVHYKRIVRSLERKSMYNQNSCFNFDSSSQYVENDVSNWDTFEDRYPDPPTYKEDILQERSRHSSDTISLRKWSSNSWGSSETYLGHSRLRSIVEIPSKNKGDDSFLYHGHGFHQSSYRKGHYSSCAKYRDYDNNDFNIRERSICTEKIVKL